MSIFGGRKKTGTTWRARRRRGVWAFVVVPPCFPPHRLARWHAGDWTSTERPPNCLAGQRQAKPSARMPPQFQFTHTPSHLGHVQHQLQVGRLPPRAVGVDQARQLGAQAGVQLVLAVERAVGWWWCGAGECGGGGARAAWLRQPRRRGRRGGDAHVREREGCVGGAHRRGSEQKKRVVCMFFDTRLDFSSPIPLFLLCTPPRCGWHDGGGGGQPPPPFPPSHPHHSLQRLSPPPYNSPPPAACTPST